MESGLAARTPYGWFATLWPLAIIFHLAGNDFFLLELTEGFVSLTAVLQLVMTIGAAAMIWRPSLRFALVIAVAHILVVATKLPLVGNHEMLLLLIDFAVILAIISRPKDWITALVPPLRWVLLIAYSAIAFSKLNSSFVDPSVSCAVIFGDEFADWINVSVSNSTVLSYMVIALTIVAEVAIPVLLMIRPLRRLGVAVGFVFHTALALEPIGHVFDFTTVLFVLFFLFLSPADSSKLNSRVQQIREHPAFNARSAGLLSVMIVGNVIVYHLRIAGVWLFDWPFFIAYVVVLFRALRPILQQRPTTPAPKLAFRLAPIMAVVVLLTSLNAVSPYLELRSAGAFNMYANLHTFDGETNHYLLPGTLSLRETPALYSPIAGGELDFYIDEQLALPEPNLVRFADTYPDIVDQVRLTGATGPDALITTQDLAAQRDGADSLIDRLLFTRAVDTSDPHVCKRFWGPAH